MSMGIYADTEDTIVALSSSACDAARGIVRLSGPKAFECLYEVLVDGENSREHLRAGHSGSWRYFRTRVMVARSIVCPAVVYVFNKPQSYTGQDMAELHVPGSGTVLEMLIESLLAKGARMARPGEFTARAFLNGKIDLSQVQAVTEVISARNNAELRAAERLLNGELYRRCSEIAGMVRDMLGLIEAELDFSEQDIEFASVEELVTRAVAIREKLEQLISDSVSWQKLHELPRVVLSGKPNVGKSSLVNALLGWGRSIVNADSGTTRDMLTATMRWQGSECELVDTAGIDGKTQGKIEKKAQHLSVEAIRTADLILWVFDVNDTGCCVQSHQDDMLLKIAAKQNTPIIQVGNKIDLLGIEDATTLQSQYHRDNRDSNCDDIVLVSAVRGDNVDRLRAMIMQRLGFVSNGKQKSGDGVSLTADLLAVTAGQRRALEKALEAMMQLSDMLFTEKLAHTESWTNYDMEQRAELGYKMEQEQELELELVALELRGVLDELGSISGEVIDEDILGSIFSRFCVGK